MNANDNDVSQWWSTAIIEMEPGSIQLRGHPIQELIGNLSFTQMIWMMTRGDIPSSEQAALLECALVAAVDHGPQAPSIATARMAVTCGLGLNGALASAVNLLDDVHGGAGEQAVELYHQVRQWQENDQLSLRLAVTKGLRHWRDERSTFIPGFGHRFHKLEDPRVPRLLALVDEAADKDVVTGQYAHTAREIQRQLVELKGKAVPMNIDGATAVIFAELGFAPPLARGLFCLSRSVGIVAHAWEQIEQGGRNKGPTPPGYHWAYTGKNPSGNKDT